MRGKDDTALPALGSAMVLITRVEIGLTRRHEDEAPQGGRGRVLSAVAVDLELGECSDSPPEFRFLRDFVASCETKN